MALYDNMKLEKGMYQTAGKSFSQVLEELDPSGNYRGTELEGLDAFQRQLKRFDIKGGGGRSDVLEKFFSTADSAALFPEYVSRAVHQGMEEAATLEGIIASKTVIDSMDYRTISSDAAGKDKELKRVAEGAFIPETTIKLRENLVKLRKRGRMLVASYEAVRFQRLDLFTVTLRQIGAAIARAQLNDAVDVLLKGDGNENPIAATALETAGEFTYNELVSFWAGFSEFHMDTLLADTQAMVQLLQMAEFKDPCTGLELHRSGKCVTPFGATLYRTTAMPEKTLVGLDRSCALEMVTAGELSVDYDKLIDRQLERAAITSIAGFSKIFDGASRKLA